MAEEFTGWWIQKVDMLPKIHCFHMERYLLSLPIKELLLQEALPKTVSVKCVRERLRPLFMFFGTLKLQNNSS